MTKRSFGKVRITDKTVTYNATSWSKASKEFNIAMYATIPGTVKSVEFPSITLDFSAIGKESKCPFCDLPIKEHEFKEDFIEKIKRRAHNKPIKVDDLNSLLVNQ